jgi:methylthioribose-1-phosphate isomerase
VHVHILEGRPTFDGARVVSWELLQADVPRWVVADSASAWLIQSGQVDVVLVGGAAIAANGDIANDIGTYAVASIAARHGVPVIVCTPLAAVDPAAPDGAALPGEERPPAEVLEFAKVRIGPADGRARNPVVDVTPAVLITGIASEEGVLEAPFGPAIAAALDRRARRVPTWTAPAPAAVPAGDPGDP